ncbi:MAG: GNAT family N-acetyltransferase [Xanthobacteraceae bacterium]|nr:MAG: GNAT family N-acetyltransferase [Xanthobacteraceae bacterium]
MGQAFPKPTLRPYLPADLAVALAIFAASVEELTGEDYSEAQQAAWIALADDEEAFGRRLSGQLTLIALAGDAPVGFASLKDNTQIDMLYVHPHAVGQGVGTALCEALEKLAGARGATRLTVEASDTARLFFTHRGYGAERRNTVPLGDEWLGTTTMLKLLTPVPSPTSMPQ